MSEPQTFRIVHAIAQLRFGAGRYVVDTAIAQHRREPGCVAVVIGEDAEPPWTSSPALVGELRTAGVAVYVGGDFFHRRMESLKAAASAWRELLVPPAGWPAGAVVHAHTAMAAAVARWAGAPRVVLTCHGWGPGRPADIDLQDALAYSMCDVVTSPSSAWADTIRKRTTVKLVPVIPYGFNLDRLVPQPHTPSPGPARIVSVGELSHRKGADLLLESMPAVWGCAPQTELHFVGDGELAGELRERAASMGAGARVVFHGPIEQPSTLLAGFNIFALASRSDNQPVAIVEAMAAGLPIVSTHVGGIAAMIGGARCGFVVPAESVADLATVLRVLAESGDVARRELGRNGTAYVRAHHDVTTHVESLEKLYRPGAARTKAPAEAVA